MSPPNKYLNCRWCSCDFLEVDIWRHDICKDFYRFTVNELIAKLETKLLQAKKLQNQLI